MNYAVLVIDVQNGLFEIDERPFEADEVINRINKITNEARSSNIPVVFIQHQQKAGLLTEGSENWKLHCNLVKKESDLVVQKTTPDSFLRTELDEVLKSKEVSNLIICGYASEFCVDTTTRRAAVLGYTVYLVADAHTTHNKQHATARQIIDHHNATLPELTSFGPKISLIKTEELFKKVM